MSSLFLSRQLWHRVNRALTIWDMLTRDPSSPLSTRDRIPPSKVSDCSSSFHRSREDLEEERGFLSELGVFLAFFQEVYQWRHDFSIEDKLRLLLTRITGGAIVDISFAGGALSLALCFYFIFYTKRKLTEESLTVTTNVGADPESGRAATDSVSPKLKGITVDRSVEFTYEELALATDEFSLSDKIG
ncbi:chitin elicitor receptor kinase 1-like [Salvia divinorum]|uniref:Chitin elicitor receptor kinase 1-like n=1 Tax=Salvia divinorum TaxID=28513 RepID=A0ABD1I4V9_SALDI